MFDRRGRSGAVLPRIQDCRLSGLIPTLRLRSRPFGDRHEEETCCRKTYIDRPLGRGLGDPAEYCVH